MNPDGTFVSSPANQGPARGPDGWWQTHKLLVIGFGGAAVLLLGGLGWVWHHHVQSGNTNKGGTSKQGATGSHRHGSGGSRGDVDIDQGTGAAAGGSNTSNTSGSGKKAGGSTSSGSQSASGQSGGGNSSNSGGSGSITPSNPPGDIVPSFSPNYWAQWSNGPPVDPNWFPITVFDNDPFFNDELVKAANINLYLGLFDFGSQYSHYVTNGLVPNNSYAMAGEALDADTILGDPTGSSHIWGYQPADEPEMKHFTVPEVQTFYDDIRAKDTSRPIFIGYGKGLALPQPQSDFFLNGYEPNQYCDIPDVVAADYYGPQDAGSGPDGGWVYGRTMDLMRAACGTTKPIWNYIDTELVNAPSDPGGDLPAPTPLEIQQHVWLSIVHGANGIVYFCHNFGDTSDPQWDTKCLVDPPRTAAITETNAQLAKYAPVLNSPTRENAVVVTGNTTKITTLTKYLDGYAYIFAMADGDATHPDSGSTSATFHVDKLDNAIVQVPDESRSISAPHGSFSDNFTPFGWHVYKIKM